MFEYDKYIVAFSGGKDSTACFLHLLELGIPRKKIELWHHEVDGKGRLFMDWECTPDYCRKFAQAFNVPIYFSWKEGGFLREMLRNNQRTAPILFEEPNGKVTKVGGDRGKPNTRRKFPQITADLRTRWCSAYLKIDVGAAAIRNQSRFNGIKTVVISGERGEESSARSKYAILEPDRADNRNGKRTKRYVDRWRPIRDWTEQEVWNIMERWNVKAHPAYYLGWGRVSCKFCIFGNANQFVSAFKISPEQGQQMIDFEKDFGCTMKRNTDLGSLKDTGEPYDAMNDFMIDVAKSKEYKLSIFTNHWIMPAGAFGESCGPS